MDGFYILRTNLAEQTLAADDVVRAYKNLEQAERAFGSFKGPDLQIRPIHHRLEDRVRVHVLICMLAHYLTWHLKQAWKPAIRTRSTRSAPKMERPFPASNSGFALFGGWGLTGSGHRGDGVWRLGQGLGC